MSDFPEDFFELRTVEEARALLEARWKPEPLGTETVPLAASAGRVLAEEVEAPEDVPPYSRSTVDGYAVVARDTFGASPSLPAILRVAFEVRTGDLPQGRLGPGEAARISTGGALPAGSDACVMLEHTNLLEDGTLLVEKPVAPGENVIVAGEDIPKGRVLLGRGRVLGPYECGALAAIGKVTARVFRKPVVAIVSTGDEIVPAGSVPRAGQIRDVNSYSLAAAVAMSGGDPLLLGVARDDRTEICNLVRQGLDAADLVVVSGGSSVGTRDLLVDVLNDLGSPGVIVHGVAVKPGKPVILALEGNTPVFGLPGHPASCLVSFDLFVAPALARLYLCSAGAVAGSTGGDGEAILRALAREEEVEAWLGRNVASAPGREDHVRVKIRDEGGLLWADPVLGKSGLVSVLVDSDGEVVVPAEKEGLYAGETVKVRVTNPSFRFWSGLRRKLRSV